MDKLLHRKATAKITLLDENNNVIPSQGVRAELINHKCKFAAGAFTTVPMLDENVPAEFRERLRKDWEYWHGIFNMGILSFYQGRYEPEEGKTMEKQTLRAAEFLKENDCRIKGHPLCWHTVDAQWLMPKTNDEVLENQLNRIRREMTAFKGKITVWDVINEAVIMPEFEKTVNAITRLCQHTGRIPLIKALFERARETDPTATLLINDFNTSVRYRDLIAECIDNGIVPDAIGIQSHQHQGPWGMEKLEEVLERFSVFNIPLHFTETTFVSGHLMPPEIVDLNDYVVTDWPTTAKGEEDQARWVLEWYDRLFAQPNVDVITYWGFEDMGQWLNAPAGLIRLDGTPKPAYDALYQRVNKDWHTDVTTNTDENGVFELSGFKGKYRITCGELSGEAEMNENGELTVIMK